MKLTIRLFAGLAEKFNAPSLEVELPHDTITAGELKKLLAEQYPMAAAIISISFVAKNQKYAKPEEPLHTGDELALIPPVSGGALKPEEALEVHQGAATSLYELTNDPIDAGLVAAKVEDPNHGASLVFIGTTREFTQGQRTLTLDYDAYHPMALATMKQIGDEIAERWPGAKCAITHRLGRVGIGETSVVIAVSTSHRAECYDASRYAIERLKQLVPIWKKELWEDGSEWKGHQLGPWDPTARPTEFPEGGAAE